MITWTREAVEALGPTTDVATTASIFGVDKDTVYAQIRRTEWTATRVLRLGRKIRIPTRDLVALLYAPEMDMVSAPQADRTVPSPCQRTTSEQVERSAPHSQCGCSVWHPGDVRPLQRAT